MSDATLTLLVLGVITYAMKAAGPVLLGSRALPPLVDRLATLLPACLLGALVATSTFASGRSLTLDSRAVGVALGALALSRRAPFVVVIAVAAGGTAAVRALGLG